MGSSLPAVIYLSSHFSVGNMERNMNTFFLLTCFMLAGLYFGSANCDCDSIADCPDNHICVISGSLLADDKCVHIDDASPADAFLVGFTEERFFNHINKYRNVYIYSR